MQKYAVIVAGGMGQRMKEATPKQFLLLRGKPVLWYTLTAFLQAFDDLYIILVLPSSHIEAGKQLAELSGAPGRISMVTGGDTRFLSVKNGLTQVPGDAIVFVHDGVRCLVTPALIQCCYAVTLEHGNAVPAIAAIDSIRILQENGNSAIDRSRVRIIQTPQTFLASSLKAAFAQEYHESFTDEAAVMERMGEKIHLVEGEETNIKITKPMDLLVAEKILEEYR